MVGPCNSILDDTYSTSKNVSTVNKLHYVGVTSCRLIWPHQDSLLSQCKHRETTSSHFFKSFFRLSTLSF